MNIIEQSKLNFYTQIKKGKILTVDELFTEVSAEDLDLREFLTSWYQSLVSFHFLPLDDETLEEIIIHSPDTIVGLHHKQQKQYDCDLTTNELQRLYEYLCLKNNVDWNYKKPFVSFYTQIQQVAVRVSLTHYSCSPHNISKCFIRVLNSKPLAMQDFQLEGLDKKIQTIIKEKKNLLICGSTGSGKTTFLNALLQFMPKDEHLVILEDIDEIHAPHPYTTKLLADEKKSEKSLNSLMKNALRMSPKRMLIGEIRSKEVETFLLAMNTGHQGLMGTVHANSAKDAIERLALLFKIYSSKDLSYELVLKLVCSNLDYVIFLNDKKVSEIINVYGSENHSILYEALYSSARESF